MDTRDHIEEEQEQDQQKIENRKGDLTSLEKVFKKVKREEDNSTQQFDNNDLTKPWRFMTRQTAFNKLTNEITSIENLFERYLIKRWDGVTPNFKINMQDIPIITDTDKSIWLKFLCQWASISSISPDTITKGLKIKQTDMHWLHCLMLKQDGVIRGSSVLNLVDLPNSYNDIDLFRRKGRKLKKKELIKYDVQSTNLISQQVVTFRFQSSYNKENRDELYKLDKNSNSFQNKAEWNEYDQIAHKLNAFYTIDHKKVSWQGGQTIAKRINFIDIHDDFVNATIMCDFLSLFTCIGARSSSLYLIDYTLYDKSVVSERALGQIITSTQIPRMLKYYDKGFNLYQIQYIDTNIKQRKRQIERFVIAQYQQFNNENRVLNRFVPQDYIIDSSIRKYMYGPSFHHIQQVFMFEPQIDIRFNGEVMVAHNINFYDTAKDFHSLDFVVVFKGADYFNELCEIIDLEKPRNEILDIYGGYYFLVHEEDQVIELCQIDKQYVRKRLSKFVNLLKYDGRKSYLYGQVNQQQCNFSYEVRSLQYVYSSIFWNRGRYCTMRDTIYKCSRNLFQQQFDPIPDVKKSLILCKEVYTLLYGEYEVNEQNLEELFYENMNQDDKIVIQDIVKIIDECLQQCYFIGYRLNGNIVTLHDIFFRFQFPMTHTILVFGAIDQINKKLCNLSVDRLKEIGKWANGKDSQILSYFIQQALTLKRQHNYNGDCQLDE